MTSNSLTGHGRARLVPRSEVKEETAKPAGDTSEVGQAEHSRGRLPIRRKYAKLQPTSGVKMPINISSQQLVDQAMKEVKTYSALDIKARMAADPSVMLVDIRDIRELQTADGTPVGSLHAPRGMLEFWVDPASKYHKPIWADENKEFVLFCGLGWRSALTAKTLQDMGMANVAHIDGGFDAMKAAGFEMETLEQRKMRRA
jgi:rhodanese-related sulfurtransferase